MRHRVIGAMRHLQVRYRLTLALTLILIPALLTSLLLLWALHESNQALEETIESAIDDLLPVARLEFHIEQARLELERLKVGTQPAVESQLAQRINQEFSQLQEQPDIPQSLAAKIGKAYQSWLLVAPLVSRMRAPYRSFDIERDELNQDDHYLESAIGQLQQVHSKLLQAINKRYAEERRMERWYERTLLAAWLIGVAVIAGVLCLLSASILKPLLELKNAAIAVQSGEYDTRVIIQGQDEFAAVGRTFNAMAATVAQTHEQLYNSAMRDPLTGLLNRRGLELALQHGCEACKSLSVIMLDLDHFKEINDSFGHDAGDEALVGMGQQMKKVVRAGDSLGRYGGDEFLMVLPGLEAAAAEDIARRLLKHLAQWNRDRSFAIATSIGIADKGRTPIEPAIIIQAADRALYRAKAAGRATIRTVHAA